MPTATITDSALLERLRKLGLTTDELPQDVLCSATSALCCLPMYMVANVPAWMEDAAGRSRIQELLSFGALREAFALGKQEQRFEISTEHGKTLHYLLSASKPTDVIVYEYALETLSMFLEEAADDLAEAIRMLVARGLVAVATASGEGWFGAGGEATDAQRACIRQVVFALKLNSSPTASAILDTLSD